MVWPMHIVAAAGYVLDGEGNLLLLCDKADVPAGVRKVYIEFCEANGK